MLLLTSILFERIKSFFVRIVFNVFVFRISEELRNKIALGEERGKKSGREREIDFGSQAREYTLSLKIKKNKSKLNLKHFKKT
jgi:hypothetical protein